MAHSLEVRVPYLDRTVVEFAERLHAGMKIRRRHGKWLHRQVCEQFLPAPLLTRKKRGFGVNVVDQWFQSSTNSALTDLLVDRQSLMFEWLDPAHVRQLLDEHRSGQDDNHKLLFSLAMFEQWLRGVRSATSQAVAVTQA
jgi:asparagine synthase (glutamine-hydrolysing)